MELAKNVVTNNKPINNKSTFVLHSIPTYHLTLDKIKKRLRLLNDPWNFSVSTECCKHTTAAQVEISNSFLFCFFSFITRTSKLPTVTYFESGLKLDVLRR